MKNLILLTNFFPYGNGEPYLETEVKYYDKYFDNIFIVSLQLKDGMSKKRELPSNKFKVIPVKKEKGYVYLIESVKSLFDKSLYHELKYLICNNKFNIKRFVTLMIYITRSHHDKKKIMNGLKDSGIMLKSSEGIIYSYRFDYQPYLSLLLKKYLPSYKCISRGHRHDLYEETRKNKYIPLRDILLHNLDKVSMISEDGLKYLNSHHQGFKDKISISRLGTLDYGLGPTPNGDIIRIVSCSTITSVKRLHLIVNALSTIKNVNIEWHHYGSGIYEDEVKSLSTQKLSSNVRSFFHGHIHNSKMMDEYKTIPFNVFVNVSSSEGVPVSIMEAMSFGIPILATNVGGTAEIVTDGYSGILLRDDFNNEQFVKGLMKIIENDEMRVNSRREWEEKSNANRLYPAFIEKTLLS